MLVQQKSEFRPRRSTAKAPWTAAEARQVLRHAAASGLSFAHYSRVHDIPVGKLAWWFERLSQQADLCNGRAARGVPAPVTFVPVVASATVSQPGMTGGASGVEVAVGHVSLRLSRDFCPQTLAKVLGVLGQVHSC
jgi:hypothetical protein